MTIWREKTRLIFLIESAVPTQGRIAIHVPSSIRCPYLGSNRGFKNFSNQNQGYPQNWLYVSQSTNLEGRRVCVVVLDDPEHADELSLGANGARVEADDRRSAVLALVDVVIVVSRLGNAAGVARGRGDTGESECGCVGR